MTTRNRGMRRYLLETFVGYAFYLQPIVLWFEWRHFSGSVVWFYNLKISLILSTLFLILNLNFFQLPLKDMRNWQLIPSALESPVKSTAVVKYSAVPCTAAFAVLQCNTDLNLPPSNWLSSSAESYGLQHVPANSTGFSRYARTRAETKFYFYVVLLMID